MTQLQSNSFCNPTKSHLYLTLKRNERRFDMKTQINGKIAIYSRKSKFTGKGESIGNQIEECKNTLLINTK